MLFSRFSDSFKSLRRTRTLTIMGIFLAIQMVLASYGTIQLGESLKISLSHLALAPTAMLFGPVAAGIQGALSDILAFLLKPTGPYFPGFTISKALSGIIYGCLFYKTSCKVQHVLIARALVTVLINILFNSFLLALLYGPGKWAMLPVRIVKNCIQYPIDCMLLYAVCRTVERVPQSSPAR